MGATGAVDPPVWPFPRRSHGDSNHGAGGVHGVVTPAQVAAVTTTACMATTAAGRPCKRHAGGPNGTDTLCGLHELARRRRAHAVREAVLIAIGPDNVARWQ